MQHSVHHKLLILQFNFTNAVAFFHFFSSLFPPFLSDRPKCVKCMLGKLIKFRYKWHRRIYISEACACKLRRRFSIHIWCAHLTETTSTAAATTATGPPRLTLAINLFKRLRINHLKVKYTRTEAIIGLVWRAHRTTVAHVSVFIYALFVEHAFAISDKQ